MKFLFASDSFKGTITSEESAQMLTEAAREVFGSEVECISIPVADGGEGTTEAVIKALGGEWISADVHGPLWQIVRARYGRVASADGDIAVIEMAEASGLPMLKPEECNPLLTTTYGTGEMIRHALEHGFKQLYIALGGSATNDGGIGCLRALGARFLDSEGKELEGTGADLIRIADIDISGMTPLLEGCRITVMCDVKNPLCGPDGATYTYGAQKGADKNMQDLLEKGMQNYRRIIIDKFGTDPDTLEGSGAAGGLGAAMFIFLKAIPKSGIETVLNLTGFDRLAKDADLVVTGEGRTDWQSAKGKVLYGIGTHCQRLGVPAVALVGGLGKDADIICRYGINSIMTTTPGPMPLQQALDNAHEYYRLAAVRMFRMLKAGMAIGQ